MKIAVRYFFDRNSVHGWQRIGNNSSPVRKATLNLDSTAHEEPVISSATEDRDRINSFANSRLLASVYSRSGRLNAPLTRKTIDRVCSRLKRFSRCEDQRRSALRIDGFSSSGQRNRTRPLFASVVLPFDFLLPVVCETCQRWLDIPRKRQLPFSAAELSGLWFKVGWSAIALHVESDDCYGTFVPIKNYYLRLNYGCTTVDNYARWLRIGSTVTYIE